MEETFDYSQVPHDFVHCFNAQCPRAGECLRQLAGRHVTALHLVVQAVSPAVWESEATLNRISHHQRPLSPDEQRVIESLFAEYGVTDGNVFDRVEMGYE